MDTKDYKLSFFQALTMAAGFTIGSGIITQTGIGIQMTGRSIFLAFLVSAVLFLLTFRPLFIMSSVLPRQSASYYYAKNLISEEAGGLYAYVYFFGRITIAIFGISFAEYMLSIFPVLDSTILTRLLAVGIVSIFFIINLFGIKAAARFQNIMFFILVFGLLLFVGFGLNKVDADFLAEDTLFIGGFHGFYQAVSLLFFAVGGAYIITDFAPKIKDSKKTVIRVIYIVTLSVSVIYMLMGVVASGAVPLEKAMGAPLTVSAAIVFKNPLLVNLFVICVCIGALLTTLNSSFVWYSNSLIEACNEGWFPKALAKENKYHVPYPLMIIFYLFGAIPALFGIDLAVLSKMAIGLTILSVCIPMAGILNLPQKYKHEWQSSRYCKRYPKWRLICMCILTYIIMLTQVFALFASNPPLANILIVVYLLLVIAGLFIKKRRKK